MASQRKSNDGGYADVPGTGPSGETCQSCAHSCVVFYRGRRLWKCDHTYARWVASIGTGIKARSPACRRWERE